MRRLFRLSAFSAISPMIWRFLSCYINFVAHIFSCLGNKCSQAASIWVELLKDGSKVDAPRAGKSPLWYRGYLRHEPQSIQISHEVRRYMPFSALDFFSPVYATVVAARSIFNTLRIDDCASRRCSFASVFSCDSNESGNNLVPNSIEPGPPVEACTVEWGGKSCGRLRYLQPLSTR